MTRPSESGWTFWSWAAFALLVFWFAVGFALISLVIR